MLWLIVWLTKWHLRRVNQAINRVDMAWSHWIKRCEMRDLKQTYRVEWARSGRVSRESWIMQSSRSLNQATASISPFPSVISINDICSCLILQRFKIRRFDWRENSNWTSLESRHSWASFPCSRWGSTSYVSIKFDPNCLPFLAIFIVIPIPKNGSIVSESVFVSFFAY